MPVAVYLGFVNARAGRPDIPKTNFSAFQKDSYIWKYQVRGRIASLG